MDGDCDHSTKLACFVRDELDNAAFEVNFLPREAATIAEAQPRVDSDGDEKRPLGTHLLRGTLNLTELLKGELAARVGVIWQKTDAEPRVFRNIRLGGDATENFPKRTDVVIVGARGVSRTEHSQIFGDSFSGKLFEVGDFEVVIGEPFGELHPNDALRGKSGGGLFAATWGLLIFAPDFGEWQELLAASEGTEHAV